MKKFLLNHYPQQILAKIASDHYFPKRSLIFKAFNCDLKTIKVLIIGQDPYATPNMADGLAFSSQNSKLPPSLRNIYKAAHSRHKTASLELWRAQGVFLLNRILTVEANKPLSHAHLGWEQFTEAAITYFDTHKQEAHVYLLWGQKAQQLRPFIHNQHALVLTTSHPSPLSVARGFKQSKQFLIVNQFLRAHYLDPIIW